MKKIGLFFVLLFCSSIVYAEPIKEIVFFGDSLTDNGNLYHYTRVLPKSPPYYEGRFSNGLVWSERMASIYPGLTYENYAVGGATVVLRGPIQGSLPVNLGEEVRDYLIRTGSHDRSHTLFSIWMGANDYLVSDRDDVSQLTTNVIESTMNTVQLLMDKGANNFMLMDLPDFAKVPYYLHRPEQIPRASILAQLHHEKMIAAINELRILHPDKVFLYIDIYALFNDIFLRPDFYNEKYHSHVTDMSTACLVGGIVTLNMEQRQSPSIMEMYSTGQAAQYNPTVCDNPDDHMFWDALHPTTVMHNVLAQIVAEKLAESGILN